MVGAHESRRPTFGSAFAGVGGFDLGLERAGWRCAWQIESDPAALAVLAHHWPAVPRYGDIRAVDPATLLPVDLLCGGFPCQDISVAGKGAGLDGAQSSLWWELARLIVVLRPPWLLVENVPPLRTRGADTILAWLEAQAYACWPLVVGAWAVGAPHRRERVWIVGQLGDAARGGRKKCDVREGRQATRREEATNARRPNEELADTDGERCRRRPGSTDPSEAGQSPPLGSSALADACRDDLRLESRGGGRTRRPRPRLPGDARP
jgi:DNA (cytosine-5)-methyltransferase 1